MSNEVGKTARETATKYEKALNYLDSAKTLNADVFFEANRIAGNPFSSSELQRMIDQSDFMLPIGGQSGGLDALKQEFRRSLVEGINTFGALADQLGVPKNTSSAEKKNKKWWQF